MGAASGHGRGGSKQASPTTGAHRCAIQTGDPQQPIADWVGEGLSIGERVLWLTSQSPDAAVRSLEQALPEAHLAVRERRVLVLRLDRVLPPDPPSRPAALWERIESEATRASADGMSGLRLVVDMSWAAGDEGDVSSEPLELVISRATSSGLCSALCTYDAGLPTELLLTALRHHPVIVDEGTVLENPGALTVAEMETGSRSRALLHKWLEYLRIQHRTVAALRASEGRFRRLYEGSPVPYQSLDREGHILQVNTAWLSALGYEPEEVVGRWLGDLMHSGGAHTLDHCLSDFISNGKVSGAGLQLTRKDGGPVDFEVDGRIGVDDTNHEPVTHCVLHDVTSRRRAERELLRLNEDLEQRHRIARIYLDDPTANAHVEVLRLVVERVGGRFGMVVHLDEDGGMRGWILPGVGSGRGGDSARPLRLPAAVGGEGAWGRALSSGSGVWSSEPDLLAGSIPVERVLVVPVVYRGQTIGAFAVADRPAPYGEADCNVLEAIAQEVAPTLDERVRRTMEERRRRAAEEALQISEERFRTVVEVASIGVLLLDSQGLITYANAEASRMMGRAVADVVGSPWTAMLPLPNHKAAVDVAERVARGGAWTGDGSFLRPDGTAVHWDGRAAPLQSRGSVKDTVLFLADTTERLRAQATLRESEQRLRLALVAANQGLYDLNVQTGHAVVTSEYATMLGYDHETFAETNARWLERLHPDDKERVTQEYVDYVSGRIPRYQVEFRQKTKAGEWKWILSLGKIAERDAAGQPLRMLGTHTDITDRKRAEIDLAKAQDDLQQAQKMEAIGKLAGGVAHDFNNILAVILSYCHIIGGQVKPDDPITAEILEVRTAAERAASLTRQLLAFSRRQVLRPRVLDLNALVDGMKSMLVRLLGEDVLVRVQLAPDAGRVKADPGQLEQVVMNLAVNSRDAMPEGGWLTISTAHEELDEQQAARFPDLPPGPYVRLTVKDAGHGMDEDTAAQVFEPFFTTKPPGQGTGLGLSSVHGVVKQSGGHVWVESAPGRGATFHILLPRLAEEVDAPVVGTSGERAATGRERILLVEDEPSIRRVAARILQPLGYQVLVAEDAYEALRLAESTTEVIDLLLTDIVMPGMSGRVLADRLSTRRPGIRILFMSGYPDDATLRHGPLRAGTHFLPKPFTPGGLSEKVREALDAPRPAAIPEA